MLSVKKLITLNILALGMFSTSVFASTEFTQLSNTNVTDCINTLKANANAVVVWQYPGCGYAADARKSLLAAKKDHADMSNVKLFYFNGITVPNIKGQTNPTDPCTGSDPSHTHYHTYCETARACLHMDDPNPYHNIYSPELYFYHASIKQGSCSGSLL